MSGMLTIEIENLETSPSNYRLVSFPKRVKIDSVSFSVNAEAAGAVELEGDGAVGGRAVADEHAGGVADAALIAEEGWHGGAGGRGEEADAGEEEGGEAGFHDVVGRWRGGGAVGFRES